MFSAGSIETEVLSQRLRNSERGRVRVAVERAVSKKVFLSFGYYVEAYVSEDAFDLDGVIGNVIILSSVVIP